MALKLWLTKLGWKVNAYFHALGLSRLPVLGRVWFVIKQLIANRLASRGGILAPVAGHLFYIHPLSIGFFTKSYEPYTTELFQSVLKPGFTVLDIGACYGYYTLIAAKLVGEKGKVYAFEPFPPSFRVLMKNIQLNNFSNVHALNKAVSDKCATMRLFFPKENPVGGETLYTLTSTDKSIPVETVVIDEVLKEGRVDVVKMDIEGHEPYALEGMRKTISRSKEMVLFVEFNPEALRRSSGEPKLLLKQLNELGFQVKVIDEEDKMLRPIEVLEKLSIGYVNLFCVKG